jgi:LysM repeat protein
MQCHACDQEAAQRCTRCGNPYCPEHGDGLCSVCSDPAAAAPSSGVFRIAFFGLLGGSVLALWLLVRPPSVPGESDVISRPEPTATPAEATAAPEGATPVVSPTAAPEGETPAPTPVPTEAPPPAETPPPGPVTYVVQEGDTWFAIASAYGVDPEALAATNGRTLDDFLQIGETIVIPQ